MNPFSRTIINGVLDRGRSLPSRYRLFYSRTPNNWLDVGWEGDFGWDSDLSSWSIPVSCFDAVSQDTFWFSNSTTPVVRTGAEIVAWAGTNNWNVLFSLTKGLAVYSLDAPLETINKARRYFNSSTTPLPPIYPTIAWGLKSSAGLTSRYGPNPIFVSSGATPDGIGGTYPANVLPVDKTYNDVYVGSGYTNLLTPAPTAPYDLTLTAQKYCLQCFDSGSVSCSYGAATPGIPLIFTATAGTTIFTPTSCGEWMLTASGGYVYPRIAHGISVVSCVGSVGGNGLSWLMDANILESLRGKTDGVEIAGSDLSLWSNSHTDGTVTHNDSSFTSTSPTSGRGVTVGPFNVNDRILINVAGEFTSPFTINSCDLLQNASSRVELKSGSGTVEWTVAAGQTYLYLRLATTGVATITSISVQKLLPSRCTVAALVRMGAGSAELPNNTWPDVLACKNTAGDAAILALGRRVTGVGVIVNSTNGTAYSTFNQDWLRLEYHLKIVQTNKVGTQFRVGNYRIGIDTAMQWSAWAGYDGSFNPLSSLRAAFNGTVPMHIKSVQVWDRGEVPEATINDWGVNRL